jgi:Fic family protein
MANLESYLHDKPKRTPILIKTAIAHVQFETIHPFLDGNGRLGRLLITLLLCAEDALQEPLLYLSLYFKSNRQEYYDRLQRVRIDGDWRGWLRFFLEGVRETAQQATETARRILDRFEHDRHQIDKLGRRAGSVLRLHQLLQRRPVLSIPFAAKSLELSAPTANSAMKKLVDLGIAMETTGKRRDRMFVYLPYMRILAEGTEPIT